MKTILIILTVIPIGSVLGQVSVNSGVYNQDFNTLPNVSAGVWVNNATLPGWYSTYNGNPTVAYSVGAGRNGTAGVITSYGSTGSTDRALGSGLDTGGGDVTNFGVCLINSTGSSYASFSLSYTGEQWARSPNGIQVPDSLAFSYQIFDLGMGSLNASSGWVSFTALDFVSPNATLTAAANSLDGNASGNFINQSAGISSVSLGVNQELWLRWTAADNPVKNDHDLAIDNLTVVFGVIPEPSTYASIAGAFSLLGAVLRRTKRSKSLGF